MKSLTPELRTLEGNHEIVLDDPACSWIVESGCVALFGVTLQDGAPHGSRRFLFDVEVGGLLVGLTAEPPGRGPAIVAVALQRTSLRRVDTVSLPDPGGDGGQAGELVEDWVRRCDERLGHDESDMDTSTLRAFQLRLVERLRHLARRESEQEQARFRDRQRRTREVARSALDRLLAVFRTEDAETFEGDDLFAAASAVGRAQGIRLVRPPTWELERGRADPVDLISRASHIRFRRTVLHDGWWDQDCGPLLGFVGPERRAVALLPDGPGRYRQLDPSTGARTPVDAAAAAELDPEAYFLYRPLPENSTSGRELIRFALRGRGADLLLILGTGIVATLLGMLTPQATALLVDHAIPDADRSLLGQMAFGLLAAAFGIALFRFSQGLAMIRVQVGADAATQAAVWDRLLNLRLSFFRGFSTGDLQSRVTAVSQIRALMGGTTLRTLFGSVVLLLNLALLFYYSPSLTLVALGVAAVSATVSIGSGVMILRVTRQELELRGEFFGLMVQLINGVAKLRVAAAEPRAFARWASEYARLARLQWKQAVLEDTVRIVNVGLSTISAILLFAISASLVLESPGGASLTPGVFLAFYVAYGTFVGAVVSLSDSVTDLMEISILMERARPILEAVPEVGESKADPGRLEGRLSLDHVTFQYAPEGPVILDEVSLAVEPGQFVALVGPSGSGKSTVMRLLLGFESPRAGGIFLDGQELSGLDIHAVRRQLGVVLQSGRINTGSVFENIGCNAQITLGDAWEAARAAGLEPDIKAMPMGMHTVISEGGSNLSGGQRQRLLIARALVQKPRLLFLDEATSALDNETQAIVSRSLESLRVTRVVIAHRLNTIRNADRIYVIDSGRVVQQGTFEQLAAEDGLFARLIARQLT